MHMKTHLLTLTLAAMALTAGAQEQRTAPEPRNNGTLPVAEFAPTAPAAPAYGQAPARRGAAAPDTTDQRRVRPSSGTFIDEPNLPRVTGTFWHGSYITMEGVDIPSMETTPMVTGQGWPVTMYLRNGNWEGTYFSDNPGGSNIMIASFNTNGYVNWVYYKQFSNSEYGKRPLRVAYNPREDMVYGFSHMSSADDSPLALIKYPAAIMKDANGNDIIPLDRVEYIKTDIPAEYDCSAFAWDPRDNSLVAVTMKGDVVRYDPVTGEPTVLFSTGKENTTYFGALGYSPTDKGFLWSYLKVGSGGTESQDTYLIDTDRKTCRLQASTTYGEDGWIHQYSSYLINEQYADPLAPKPANVERDSFEPHGASGVLNVRIPSQKEDGTALSGDVTVYVHVDGITAEDRTPYFTTTAAPGALVKPEIKDLSEGLHRITVWLVSADGHWSRSRNVVKYVGYDAPAEPQNVTLDAEYLQWDPVTEGINGQDISADGIEYKIWVDGEVIGTTTSNSYKMEFSPTEMHNYLAAVQGSNHGSEGPLGYSNRLTVGQYRSIPATYLPDDSDLMLVKVFDTDADGRTWAYYQNEEAFVKQSPTTAASATNDDWLMLAPVNFDDPQALYQIAFDFKTSGNYEEQIELRLCDEAVTGTGDLLLAKKVNSYEHNREYSTFSTILAADGVKYLAFHSLPGQTADIYLKNIRVTKTGSTTAAPAAVESPELVPGDQGALPTTLKFRFPSKAVNGSPLSGDVTVTVTDLAGNFTSASATGAPGSEGSILFTPNQGATAIRVQPSAADNYGLPTDMEFWAGMDVPGMAQNLSVSLSADPRTILIDFDSPGTVGEHGGYASPAGLGFHLMIKTPDKTKWTQYQAVDYTDLAFELGESMPQGLYGFGIMTKNNYGSSEKWDRDHTVTAGPAYTLPMRETLPGGSFFYSPYVNEKPSDEYTGTAAVADPSVLKPEYAVKDRLVFGLMPDGERGGKAQLQFPLFSTVGAKNPTLVIHALLDPDLCAKGEVFARTYGNADIKIGEWDATTPGLGYTPLVFPLPEALHDQQWVMLYVDGTFQEGERRYVIFKGWTVMDAIENDLGLLSVVTPEHMNVGQEAVVRATIVNHSVADMTAPRLHLTITDGAGVTSERDIDPADASATIGPDCELEYAFTLTPTSDMLGTMHFTVTLPEDAVSGNNKYDATGQVEVGDNIMSTRLSGGRRAEDPSVVDLDWDAPYLFAGTADMENLPAWSIEQNLGQFLNIDRDGGLCYSWENWNFPHEEEARAFIVFDDTLEEIPDASRDILKAHSGHKFLLANAPLNYVTAHDWLISPEVEPGSDVSFWLSSLSVAYGPDQVGLYWSDGSTNPDDFRMLSYIRKTTVGWEEITGTLPAEAKRFAIEFYSNDTFGVLIDDITYTPKGGIPTLLGFELERDGELLQSFDDPARLDYTDLRVPDTELRYQVYPTVLTDAGSHRGTASPTLVIPTTVSAGSLAADGVSIRTSGSTIIVEGVEAAAITVTTADGLTLQPTALLGNGATYTAAPGVYIVSAGPRTAKVYLR